MFGMFDAAGPVRGAGSRAPRGAVACALTTAQHARQAVARLEQVTRDAESLSDPAQVYHLMGVLGQLGQSFAHSLDHLGRWWELQERTHRLGVEQGPFADDPSAAVATTIVSLTAAVAACADLTAALERAQICTSDLTYAEPSQPPLPRTLRRLRLR